MADKKFTYKVTFSRLWPEYADVEVEADDDDEARRLAQDAASDGSLDWESSHYGPDREDISDIEIIEEHDLAPDYVTRLKESA